jgi:DNA-directed RNA polymerase subunit K/omega
MEKGQMIVNYENQAFDDLDINPYEVVIAVSKTARDINDKAQKFLSHDMEINAIGMALERLKGKTVRFVYKNDGEKGCDAPSEES